MPGFLQKCKEISQRPNILQGHLALPEKKHTHTHTHTHTSQKPSKIAAAENLFPSLYAIGTAMNVFITYDIYKTLFNTEIYRYLEIF